MTALSELLAGSWLDNWLMIIPLMFVCLFINMRYGWRCFAAF